MQNHRADPDSLRRIGVVGCGLIGGSIALSLSNSGHDVFIVDKPENREQILKQIPAVTIKPDLTALCSENPEVIFLCVPSDRTIGVIEEIAPLVSPGAVITDVAGVKLPIMVAAGKVIPENVYFVGGHPMAGSEKSGVEAAQPFLFQNAVYVLSPLGEYSGQVISPLVEIVQQLGARILFMDAAQHDKIAAAISHLPQLLAVELVNLVNELSSEDEHYNTLAAGGFRDMTRIASSEFSVWRDVISANRKNIGSVLDALIRRLSNLDLLVREARLNEVGCEFEEAQLARTKIKKGGKGFLRPLYDMYVVVEDRVGVLKEITSTLADSGINIKDIELLKVREGAGGMFRLSFETGEILEASAKILERQGFQILRKEFEG
ncbi:MAG: prephenate dehydrogenase [Bacteroidetes bacterium]|nr:prephenate dehydrogenase [Bacteroidota bacterium]MCL5034305.1 prephenate dehydrogenase [Bacteroidota bacterium]